MSKNSDYNNLLTFIDKYYCPVVIASDERAPSAYDLSQNIIFLKKNSFLYLAHELGHFLDLNKYFIDEYFDDDFEWSCYKELIAILSSYYILDFFKVLPQYLNKIAEDTFYYENLSSNQLKKRAEKRAFDLVKKFALEYNSTINGGQ